MAVAGTINSDLVAAGQGNKSVYPGTAAPVYGSLTIPAGTSFDTADALILFSVPGPNSSIVDYWLDVPALVGNVTLTLTDGTNVIATVTSTVATGGGVVGVEETGNHGKFGKGVQYTVPTTIKLVPQTGTTSTVGASAVVLYFGFGVANY